jgi:hypothetical protein
MLKYLAVILTLTLAFGAFADHDNILMYSDTYSGMNPPKSALQSLGWTYTGFENGNYSGFISALNGSDDWNIVVVDNWMYYCSGMGSAMSTYLGSHDEVTMWFDSYSSGEMSAIASAFEGQVGSAIYYYSAPPVYVWDDEHPIFEDVDPNWSTSIAYTIGYYLNWVSAREGIPILGFVEDETAWQAGLVVGNDGRTILGGYNPTYDPDEAVDIWENIFEYLDDPGFKPGNFSLLTPEDGAIIDVFTRGAGDDPVSAIVKADGPARAGTIELRNPTQDPVDVDVEFTWELSEGAEEYQFLVDDDYNFASPIVDEMGITEETYTYTFTVDHSMLLYWRVVAWNENGEKPCNEDFSFEFDYNNTNVAPVSLGTIKATFK